MRRPRLAALLPPALCLGLPLLDLAWNLTHLNIGLPIYGSALAAGLCQTEPRRRRRTSSRAFRCCCALRPRRVLIGGYILSAGGL